jgi:hypothetical protein
VYYSDYSGWADKSFKGYATFTEVTEAGIQLPNLYLQVGVKRKGIEHRRSAAIPGLGWTNSLRISGHRI